MKSLLFLVALLALLGGVLRAADYTLPSLYTRLEDPSDLTLTGIQILQETDLGDGRTLVEVTANLENSDEGVWDVISAGATDALDAFVQELETRIDEAIDVAVDETLRLERRIHLVVDNADLLPAIAEMEAELLLQAFAESVNGAILENTPEIVFEIINTAAITLSNGQVLLEFAVEVSNHSTEDLAGVTVEAATGSSTLSYRAPSPFLDYTSGLPAYGARAPDRAMTIAVPTADLPTVRAAILDGSGLALSGRELWVFNAPPAGLDGETEDAFEGGSPSSLTFTATTGFLDALQPGALLVADAQVHHLAALDESTPGPEVIARYLPFLASGVQQAGDKVTLLGARKDLVEVVRSATFRQDSTMIYDHPVRDPYDPVLENNYTRSERTARNLEAQLIEAEDPHDGRLADLRGMNAIPWHFNELSLNDRVRATGEILIRTSGLQLEIKIRNFQVERAVAHIDAGVEMNVVFEVGPADPNASPPPLEGWRKSVIDPLELLDLVPPIVFNVGGVPVTIQPTFRFDLGVDLDFPTALTLPLQSAFTIGADMGWERSREEATGNGYFYAPFRDILPLRVSDPSFVEDLSATASFWAEFAAGMEGSVAFALAAHPEMVVRFQNDLTVSPLVSPLWSVEATGSLAGQFGLKLLGIELVDTGGEFATFPLYALSAPADAGPSAERHLAPIGTPEAAARRSAPAAGGQTRWARALQGSPTAGSVAHGFVCLPEVGDEVIVSFLNQTQNKSMIKLDGRGALLDQRIFGLGHTPTGAFPLPGGNLLVCGWRGFDVWLAEFTPDLEQVWMVNHRSSKSFTSTALVPAPDEPGGPFFYLVGHLHHGTIVTSDPAVIKFDAAGAVVWARYYAVVGDDETYDGCIAQDGGLVLCGSTSADVAPPPRGTPASGNVLVNASSNGLLMKITPAGEIAWTDTIASRWGLKLTSVVEHPDGTLFVGGYIPKPINVSYPSILFAKFAPDGTLLDHVGVGEHPDWPDELATGGNSPWDTTRDLIWTPDGLWACGSTGLGDASSGWIMSLTEELGVKLYAITDGPLGESFLSLAEGPHGILAMGSSRSVLPVGTGGYHAGLLLQLPWEGIVRMQGSSGLDTFLLQPQVYHSSVAADFAVYSQLPTVPPQTFSNSVSPVDFITTDFALEDRDPINLTTVGNPVTVAPAEKIERVMHVYDDWADANLLSAAVRQEDGSYPPNVQRHPGNDLDGDGIPLALEAYLGLDPWIAEPDFQPFTIAFAGPAPGTLAVSFDRLVFGQPLAVALESATDPALPDWSPLAASRLSTAPLDDGYERITVEVPAGVSREFLRFRSEDPTQGSAW